MKAVVRMGMRMRLRVSTVAVLAIVVGVMAAALSRGGYLQAQTTGAPLNLGQPVTNAPNWGTTWNNNAAAINAWAATTPSFPAGGTPGIVYKLTLTTSRLATSTDVVNLWTSCTSGFLAFDGTCSAGGGLTSFTAGNLSSLFTTSLGGSPLTSPALTFTPVTAAQATFLAGPASGGTGAYSFRAIVPTDIPTLNQSTTGNAATANEAIAIGGVTIGGTPVAGNIPVAASSTTAVWGTTPLATLTAAGAVMPDGVTIGIASGTISVIGGGSGGPPTNVFYVSQYAASGSHTQYDVARVAADAYASAHKSNGSVLILMSGQNPTCDDVPLPSLGSQGGYWGTTSIIGWGSNNSFIQKQTGCTAAAATLAHGDSPNGQLSRGWYQGFTVDANHIDSAGCDIHGMGETTFLDVACGNSIGGDHAWEMGDTDAGNLGWADNIYGYNLHTFDYVGVGKGAQLTPVWTGTALTGVTLVSGGTKNYSSYLRATLIGSGVAACTTMPTLQPTKTTVSTISFPNLPPTTYGVINGATITLGGNCPASAQANIFVLIQDGVPYTYGFKASNMADSHIWDLEATGQYLYAEYFGPGSGNNNMVGEHPYTNATYEIYDASNGNRHTNVEFDSPGYFGAYITGPRTTFQNSDFLWDGTAYVGSGGYYFYPEGYAQNVQISGSICNDTPGSGNWTSLIANNNGPVSASNPISTGVNVTNSEECNGSYTSVNMGAGTWTSDKVNYTVVNPPTKAGVWFGTSPTVIPYGIHGDINGNNMLWLQNEATSGGDVDGFGIDPVGQVSISVPINGSVAVKQVANPGAPTFTITGPGSTSYTYACAALDTSNKQTAIGATGTVTTGNATLSSSNYVTITCPFVEGFKNFNVYRQTNGGSLAVGYIGQITKSNYERGIGLKDTGQTVGAAQPSVNATGTISTSGTGSSIGTGTTANTDLAGQLTLASGTAAYSFAGTYTSAPICTATDTTSVAAVQAAVTTTTLTLNGTSTDVLDYVCIVRQ